MIIGILLIGTIFKSVENIYQELQLHIFKNFETIRSHGSWSIELYPHQDTSVF
jgi:hypothetical protein